MTAHVTAAELLDKLPDAVLVTDAQGRILLANGQASVLTGYSIDELRALRVEDLVPAAVRARHQRDRAGYIADGVKDRPMGTGLDVRVLRRDGREVACDISLGAVGAGPGLVVATVRDVSERHRLEADLDGGSHLLELAHDCVIVRRTSDSTITLWNQGATAAYGYTRREALGRVSHDLLATVFPSSREDVDAHLASSGSWEGELIHRRRDASWLHVASRQVVLRSADGSATSVFEVNRDITEVRRAHARLGAELEVTTAIHTALPPDDLLGLIAARALDLVDGATALIGVGVGDGSALEVRVAHGDGAESIQGRVFAVEDTLMGEAMLTRSTQMFEEATLARRTTLTRLLDMGPALVIPLIAEDIPPSVLEVSRHLGARPFTQRDLDTLTIFAGIATMALRTRHLQDRIAVLALVDDRERIARALHTDLTREIFEVTLTLQSLSTMVRHPALATRLNGAVEELDGILQRLRETVFNLNNHASPVSATTAGG